MIEAREEENAPYVLVYFNCEDSSKFTSLIIKNIGTMPAKNIKIKFNPPIQSTYQEYLDKFSAITNGIPSLAPNQKIGTLLDFYPSYYEAKLPMTYKVTLTYSSGNKNKQHEDTQFADVSMYEGRMYVTEKGIPDLVKNTQAIAKHLDTIAGEMRNANRRNHSEGNAAAEEAIQMCGAILNALELWGLFPLIPVHLRCA